MNPWFVKDIIAFSLAVSRDFKGLARETRKCVTPKAPLRSKALDEVGGVCGEGLQDIVSLLAGS
jgi:hypothetical protein